MANVFQYKVRDRTGKLLTGELEADDVTAVVTRLRQQGFMPISIDRKSGLDLNTSVRIPGLTDRVKLKELAIFSRQFATMVSAGLTLLRSLVILEEQTQSKALTKVVASVRADVEAGNSLSESMAKHPRAFNDLYVAMIRSGESGGVLDDTMLRLADTIEKQLELRQKVKSAMSYPAMAMSLILVIMAAMLIFIVPQFKDMYAELGGELPLPTQILLFVSSLVVTWGLPVGLPLVIIGIFLFSRWKRTAGGKAVYDRFLLKIPVFGKLMHKTALARFARTLSALLRSGVPILEALDIVSDTVNNAVVSRGVQDVKESVRGGESLAAPLYAHKIFPPMVVQMMAVGEETGALDNMLEKIADFYDSEVAATVDALTSLIEPILIVTMGIAVGAMLISLYLPMFNIIKIIK